MIESSATAPLETVFAGDIHAGNDGANIPAGAVFVYTEPVAGWASTSTATATLSPVNSPACTAQALTTCTYYFGVDLALDSTTVIVGDYSSGGTGTTGGANIYAFGQPAGGWASTSGTAFAVINTNGAAWSGRTYSIAGACTNVYLGDVFTEALDVVGDPTAASLTCNPTLKVVLAGTGSGSVTGPKISCGTSCTASYPQGTALTLTAAAAAGSGFAGWSGAGCTGKATCSITLSTSETVTATFDKPPVNEGAPKLTGTAKPGHTLICSNGSWTNGVSSFGYQWIRDGVPLFGNTRSRRTVVSLDEGSTLTCVVTANNPGGSKTADSKKVKVPIPLVKGCPGATGSLTGTKLGLIHLDMTDLQARAAYVHHSDRGKQFEDFFCLTPIGVRVGYASPKLLRTLPRSERRKLANRVVWASTSNPFYSLDGVRVGESIAIASALLHTEPPFHIGPNLWYLARTGKLTLVLKVRGGAVQEVGIAVNNLTGGRSAQNNLLHSFE